MSACSASSTPPSCRASSRSTATSSYARSYAEEASGALLEPDTWDEHYRGKSPREAWEILSRDIARADAHMHGRTGSPPADFAAFGDLVDAALDSERIEERLCGDGGTPADR